MKPYDSKLDKEIGQPAEKAVMKYLHSVAEPWWTIKHWPYDEYDIDIVVVAGEFYNIDVELRTNWKSGQGRFPFNTIHVPARKKALIERRRPFTYFAVREDMKYALLIDGDVILNSPIVPVPNRLTEEADDFFDVPIDRIMSYRRLDGAY